MSDFKSKTKTASSELFDPQVEYYTRNFFAGLATFWFGTFDCCCHIVYIAKSHSDILQAFRVHILCRSLYDNDCRTRRNCRWAFRQLSERLLRISFLNIALTPITKTSPSDYDTNNNNANIATVLFATNHRLQSTTM